MAVEQIANVDKIFFKGLFKNLFSDPIQLEFWDGEVEDFGNDKVKFKIKLNEPLSKADILKDPSLAFGEGYMTKKMDIDGSLEDMITSLYNTKESFLNSHDQLAKLGKFLSHNFKNSKEDVQYHYDIGNDFYRLWLDKTMTYSCAYFKSPEDTLEEAQKNKVEHILKKLALTGGETLLDIGCGWGELILTAARNYKVKASGITLSSEQFTKVNERIKAEKLEDLVDVQLIDYRELKDRKFDRVVSVGMVEHVGQDHLSEYFSVMNKLLIVGGVSLLHCITSIEEGSTNSWISKYIFPGGYIPAIKEIITSMADHGNYLLDVESLRRHYGRTLEHWARNFEKALPEISKTKDETFIRMWRLYLNSCAASFNCGNIDVHQFLFIKGVNNTLPWTRA
ncbi:cyclopropane-fatty-acyl-phospholipid synthase family protein [Desulfitobacterium sp.]|uniref:cyclopropane-fatty-acyl-phospholipid synthase family protein n=1 Tax=Desulfitobacterium sp. TaxID=49981 RepID=UPI002CFDD6BB|nr:cyclopropane-fatty-acyl-phospholipid synthase family protein [Desulfitobacterium sp.]HVJ48063.1 cyclopropane-fatty-acyl-phospholipid synthase family protein [Desulfitobacterium sp.]